MAEPTQEEYFTDWIKPFPRDVTKFGIKSSDLKTITYNIPFYLYGIKFYIIGSSFEMWYGNSNASDFIKSITQTFTFNIKMTFENETTETKTFYITTTGKDDPNKSFVKTGKKIKKIEIQGGVRQESQRSVLGGYNKKTESYWGLDGKLHTRIIEIPWYYTVTKYTYADIQNLKLYEHPYIDSGMRIAGANGKIYTPAETVFPSPLRIFHKRVRNIMLVPLGCDYASVFKIKTKDGIQAITTLS
ncbi:hypothetical protein [Treponema putidum]|uniref:hypothetical protein n=1 Tax=Treponema putidum TaxID=221027 RepID=UPI003D8CCF9D